MNQLYAEVTKCRLCKNDELEVVVDLGEMALSGVFPKPSETVGAGPLTLVHCNNCGLVQLKHSYNPGEMYGMNYGYKSSLNRSMLVHLYHTIKKLEKKMEFSLLPNDVVLDIGSNDGSTLSFYNPKVKLVGVDPTGIKFKDSYRADMKLIPDFFSAATWRQHMGDVKPKIITSIAMMYDLEEPTQFFREVADILHPEGIWHIEQSYLPLMLQQNAYDTICHEHIEYYSLKQIKLMATLAGLTIVETGTNDINGGSFYVTMKHSDPFVGETINPLVADLETRANLDSYDTYVDFTNRIQEESDKLVSLLASIKAEGKTVIGYGASTKGNILLHNCKITTELLPAIAEVNPDKFGCVTPGTNIPIISESDARKQNPDYFLVLPWHFKANILEREKEFLRNGGKFIFPLPEMHIVSAEDV